MKNLRVLAAVALALLLHLPQLEARGVEQCELSLVASRMYSSTLKGAPSDAEVELILKGYNAAGYFTDIDYLDEEFNSGDKKRPHLAKTQRLAKAYLNPKSRFFQSEELYTAIESLLSFWLKSDLDDDNWWHRSIGFPKDMMPTLVLMQQSMGQRNAALYAQLVDYLGYSWDNTPPRLKKGANGTDISKITFAKAALSGDKELMCEVMEFVISLIYIAQGGTQEGIYPDNSFSQHCENGRQLYVGTYGREYLDGVLFFMEYTQGTSFAVPAEKITMIEDLLLEGVAWVWYKNELDPAQCGRKMLDKVNFAPSFIPIVERMIALETAQNRELRQMLEMMNGTRTLCGNRAYPYHDYMIHRGEGSITSIRMTSKRTVGNEAGNGQGEQNYHTGDGATYFKVHGGEYPPIFNRWNWRMIPGTTVIVDESPMPKPMWGKGGSGGHDYAGVVSDGGVGVAGFIFEKDQLTAHKSWFNIDGCTIALGSAISSERDDFPAITTINQTALAAAPAHLSDGVIWHHDIAYQNLCDHTLHTSSDDGILKLWIDHGVSPAGDSYAYAVYPAISVKEAEELDCGVEILSNTADIQAIKVKATGQIMAVFYTAAELTIDKKSKLSLSGEALIICTPTKDGYTIQLGNPYCETASLEGVVAQIVQGKKVIAEVRGE